MPIARPQFNKTLQRVKLQSKLDSVMNLVDQNTANSTRTLKFVSQLFNRKIKNLKNDPLSDFLVKQPQLKREITGLISVIEQFTESLENLKNQSPIVQELLETVDVAEIEENVSEFIEQMEKLALNDLNGHSESNGVKVNGHSNGTTNGLNESSSPCCPIIDEFKWKPRTPEIPLNLPLDGTVCVVNHPSDFYVQPYDGIIEFTMKLQNEQEKLIQKGLTSFEKIAEGMYCAARYHEDFYWYRARVVGIIYSKDDLDEIEMVQVVYLDYGNKSEITPDNIMPLATTCSSQKLLAVNCHFVDIDPENEWPSEATQTMKQKLGSGRVKVSFDRPSQRISDIGTFPFFPVDLTFEGTNRKVFETIRKFSATD